MAVLKEERQRILTMVETGQVSASEAAQLFDALLAEPAVPEPPPSITTRTLRVWVTDRATRSRQVNLTATLPVNVLRIGLQALGNIIPPLRDERIGQIVTSLEQGVTGRVMDLQDLEDGKRIEIFIEQ
jgi:hypothetical protein